MAHSEQTDELRQGGGGHVRVTVISKPRSRDMSYTNGFTDDIAMDIMGAQVYKLSL